MLSFIKDHAVAILLATAVILTSGVSFAAEGTGTVGSTTSILDFSELANTIRPVLATAIQAAAGIGVLVLAATAGWRFLRRFISG